MTRPAEDPLRLPHLRASVAFIAVVAVLVAGLALLDRHRRASQLAELKARVCSTELPADLLASIASIPESFASKYDPALVDRLAALFPAASNVRLIFRTGGVLWIDTPYSEPAPRGRSSLPEESDWDAVSQAGACTAFETDREFTVVRALGGQGKEGIVAVLDKVRNE